MRNYLAILLFFLLIHPGNIFAAPDNKDPKSQAPVVEVQRVHIQNINPAKEYVGHVRSIQSVELMARVEGYLEEIHFQEGSYVNKGDLLYVIEKPPYKARLKSAQAQVVQARADLFKAKSRLRRLRAAQPESIPKTKMDDAIAAKDLARGKLDQAKAKLKLAQINMGYTTVEAPISGRIAKTNFDQGDLVSPSSKHLAQIKQIHPIQVVFSVGETNISFIQKALQDSKSESAQRILSVELEFTDGSKYPETGKIDFVDNRVDESTGTIAIWAKFENSEGRLTPGEYVNVLLTLENPQKMPVVPLSCVQRDQQGPFVFVVDKKKQVQKRRIGIERTISGKVAVKTGLEKGDKVIVQGIPKVKPGKKVQIAGEN